MKSETNKTPALRFHAFAGDWTEARVGDVTSYVDYRGKTPLKSESGVFLVTSKNVKVGYIDYECSKEYIPKDSYDEVMRRGQPLLGDVLITTEAPLGNVASIDRIDVALAQRIIKLRGKENVLSNDFLKHILLSPSFQKLLHEKSTGSTAKGIKGSVLHKLPLVFPSMAEQQKIATLLSAVDEKIGQLGGKKELLLEYKKSVMNQLFDQNIRLKDGHGDDFPDWEEKKLGDIATFSKGSGISKEETDPNGLYECIRYGELYTHYSETIDKVVSLTNLPKSELTFSKENDVIIPSSGETNIDIARAACVLRKGIALGGDLTIIRSNLNGVFLSYYLNSKKKYDIARLAQGVSVVHLYPNHLAGLKLEIPSTDEQRIIADFLSSIDKKIALVGREIDETRAFKKGLLQKMFI
jgi:type I restriction enzyme S subunit